MLAKALNLCAQPMKWDETSFNTPFGTKMCKKLYFHDFLIQTYGAIGQKYVTHYPGMLPRDFGLEIVHLALSQHPDGMIKKSQITLFVKIKVKVRSGCVSDRFIAHFNLQPVRVNVLSEKAYLSPTVYAKYFIFPQVIGIFAHSLPLSTMFYGIMS